MDGRLKIKQDQERRIPWILILGGASIVIRLIRD